MLATPTTKKLMKHVIFHTLPRTFLVRQHMVDGHFENKVIHATNVLHALNIAESVQGVSHAFILRELAA